MNRILTALILGISLGTLSWTLAAPLGAVCANKGDEGVKALLENKTAKDKATIKGQEIAKVKCIPKTRVQFSGADYYIEVTSLTSVAGGVEVIARAWDSNNVQIGFGKDGTVDLERFIIQNPPILVSDPAGSIIREWVDETGQTKQFKYREDISVALLQSLAHTIKVKQQKFGSGNIVAGKVGNTTTTVYPDADPESTSVDGRVQFDQDPIVWADLVNAAGNGASDTEAFAYVAYFESSGTNNQFQALARGIHLFDTSAIGDTDTIDSATLSIFGHGKLDALNATPDINIYSSAPAANTAVVAGDYDSLGSTEFSTTITYANFSTTAYNDFALNASGLAGISATGISKFGTRNANHDVANSAPTWAGSLASFLRAHYADQTGTANDPKLVVEHTATGGGGATEEVSNSQVILTM